jgi:hypothetical protein
VLTVGAVGGSDPGSSGTVVSATASVAVAEEPGAASVGAEVVEGGSGALSSAITSARRSAGLWVSVTSRVTSETPAALTSVATIVVAIHEPMSRSR